MIITITQGGAVLAGGEVRRTIVMSVESAPAVATSQQSVRSVVTVPAAAARKGNTGRATMATTRASKRL